MRLLVTPDGRDSFWLAVKPSSYTPPDRHADYLGVVDWITVLFISLFDWKGAKYRLNLGQDNGRFPKVTPIVKTTKSLI